MEKLKLLAKSRYAFFILTLLSTQVFFSCAPKYTSYNFGRTNYGTQTKNTATDKQKVVVAEPVAEVNKEVITEEQRKDISLTTEAKQEKITKAVNDQKIQKKLTEIKEKIEKQQAEGTTYSAKMKKQDAKEFRKAVRDVAKVQEVDALELILAIFIPPLGVLLHDDGLTTRFWISLILTLLFFIPGMIYAILVVTDTI
jgi:uncharacterized membrane protein YqaE (UPF0057 family)